MRSDLEIARDIQLRPIGEIASAYGIPDDALEPYGRYMAKVDHRLGTKAEGPARGKYVMVTAITPTPAGEGKTVHTVGLSLALNKIGKKAACAIRQPSMGPVFGIKGGAAGGGFSQVVPMEDFNLHLTGDFHAAAAANNLLSAAIDASILLDNPLEIDPFTVTWRRVVDCNDRVLRQIVTGLGGKANGVPMETGFDITSASEVMAILGMSDDLADVRRRLGRIVIGQNRKGEPVTADDLECAGAMAAILRRAIDPTIMQTTEGTLAFVHTGPFANIAHGNSSIVADRVAAHHVDYLVTEAGFGADMGAEKFFDIKCRASGMRPDAVLLVATIRALKMHSGQFAMVGGKLPPELSDENVEAVRLGCSNLEAQVKNVRKFGVPVVVAINRFPTDTAAEIALVQERALAAGARAAEISEVHGKGGAGGEAIARAIVAAAESGEADFSPLYPDDMLLADKVKRLAHELYGAETVEIAPAAAKTFATLEAQGYGHLPVCVAKTQYSLSHDASLKGAPRGFAFPVREARLAAGAGFVVVYAGTVMTMPGLGRTPAYKQVDIDENGEVIGLF
ncbi:Formate--tetrahydrofolate ligase [Planctomycetes bacterium Poly30]|uniref:Formate--tetrahydrofolate ligase n=1 Tax=Saltatorellus ferox TaxID=2528018 RepID=A0A518EKI5_9BACT|nr:Formate--tetrahydrofolate ligase [Planctomycetes bacterium Poly30]